MSAVDCIPDLAGLVVAAQSTLHQRLGIVVAAVRVRRIVAVVLVARIGIEVGAVVLAVDVEVSIADEEHVRPKMEIRCLAV